MATLAQARVAWYKDDGLNVTTDAYCQQCTVCPIVINESGGSTVYTIEYLAYQWNVYNLCTSATISALITHDSFSDIANRFLVSANGATVYNSTCVTGSVSTSFTIPAGTNEVQLVVYGNCNLFGAGDLWSVAINCA
jgi:hypothetical protein